MSGPSTPSQTVGPYFSLGFSWLERADLTRGAEKGPGITIRGRVLDGEDHPVPDAVLEIWQADAIGRYAHPEDAPERMDANSFLGFGRVPVNENGEFHFVTIQPGSVSGAGGKLQAPHLNISLFMRGLLRQLTTRIYFAGEAGNETDLMLGLVPPARRQTLLAQPCAAEKKTFLWDVHLQGEQETVFFDC